MKTTRAVAVVFSSIMLWSAAPATLAEEQPLRFLHALQRNGYGDMAVEYLTILDQQADLTQEVREVWDLEMSESLKVAAAGAFDEREYEAMMEQSQKYLAKFLQEKPDHPDAAIATASWGDFLMARALGSLRAAKLADEKDKSQHEKHLANARALLTDAREKFEQAEKKFRTRLAELPPPPTSRTRRGERDAAIEARQQSEADLHEARFQLALIEYYLAETCADPKDPERTAALLKAAQAFDDIFQRNRGNVIGLYAHMWHGKTAEELDNLQMAMDIYDEVLANAPSPTERSPETGLEPLFAQVEHFRMIIVAKQKPRQFVPEATGWLREFRRLRETDGYQGIALELAKAKLALAAKATGQEKVKITAEVLQLVTECAKIRSQYQQELVLMRREILKRAGRDLEANTFDEAVAWGNAAVETSDWTNAMEAYEKAIAIAEKTKLKDPAGIAAVRDAIDRGELMIAHELFNQGKLNECMETVGKIVHDPQGHVKKQSDAAAQASTLGVTAALNLYVAAGENAKPAALKRLMEAAEFTEKNWPNKPEADDARMARGQAKLVVGKVAEAIDIFNRVNPKSERYPTARYMAGQNYWRLYVTEKTKAKAAAEKDQTAAYRAKAKECLTTALKVFRESSKPGEPTPSYMFSTQLLLAEICNEGGEPEQAATLYQPLVDAAKADKPKTFDVNTIRIFLGAVRAYAAFGQIDKAGEASDVLIELGPDTLQVNHVLVEFARLLNLERKKAEARVTELENTGDVDAVAAAHTQLASVETLLGKTLVTLSERQELGLGHMMFIGQAMNTVGMTAEASRQFQKVLGRMETDPEFAKQAERAMSLIRTELLKVLRKQGIYEEALKQVNQLIKENPRALEPLMEKGRILEAWAEKDPTKFDEAVGHWTMLRSRLQGMRKKPDEYYDVMYNVAKCLVREAEKCNDKAIILDRAKKAEQVLKSALILSPKLNGPDTVARYKVLVEKAITMQGRSPD